MRKKKKFIFRGGLIGGIVGVLFSIILFTIGYFGGGPLHSTFFWITLVIPSGIIKTFFKNENIFLMLITFNIVYFLIGAVIGSIVDFVVIKFKLRK